MRSWMYLMRLAGLHLYGHTTVSQSSRKGRSGMMGWICRGVP
jgi:hypothetical protein